MLSAFRIGLWLDDLHLGIRAGLKAAAPLGMDEIGLDALGTEVAPHTLSQTGRRDLAHHIRHAGLTVAALKADVGGRRFTDGAALDANLTRLRDAFALAQALRAPRVVVPLGFVPPHTKDAHAKPHAALCEAVKVLATLSTATGIRPAVLAGGEPPEVLAAFLKEHDSSGWLDVDLNPGGFVSRGVEPLAALNALAPRVVLASAADYFRGGGEAPFGQGDVPWGELIVGLATLSRREPLTILAACTRAGDRLEALADAVAKLKRLRVRPMG